MSCLACEHVGKGLAQYVGVLDSFECVAFEKDDELSFEFLGPRYEDDCGRSLCPGDE